MDALRDALRQIGRFRGKRCVLITDMKGSTAIFSEEGDMAAVIIQRQRDLLREEIDKVGGKAWAVGGDGILAFFEASRDALKAVQWGQVFPFDIADYREKVKIQDLNLSSTMIVSVWKSRKWV